MRPTRALLGCVPTTPPAADAGESSSEGGSLDPTTTTFTLECTPGEQRCADAGTREVCQATGLG